MKMFRKRLLAGVLAVTMLLNNMSTLAYAVDDVVNAPPETVETGPSEEELAAQAAEQAAAEQAAAEEAARQAAEAEAAAQAEAERLAAEQAAAEESARQAAEAEAAAQAEAERQAAEQKAAEEAAQKAAEQAENEAEEVATSSNAGTGPSIDEPVTQEPAEETEPVDGPAVETDVDTGVLEGAPAIAQLTTLPSDAGVSVQAVLPQGTQLSVSAGDADAAATAIDAMLPQGFAPADVQVWEITLTDADGNAVQPQSDAVVTLPAAPKQDSAVYYIHDGVAEKVADLAAGKTSFTVAHFSTYAVAAQVPVEVEEKPEDKTKDEPVADESEVMTLDLNEDNGIMSVANGHPDGQVNQGAKQENREITVYLYVKITGDNSAIVQKFTDAYNKDGYLTIGYITVAANVYDIDDYKQSGVNAVDSDTAAISKAVQDHKAEITYVLSDDLKNQPGFDVTGIDWSAGQATVSAGARDLNTDTSKKCWHLDGEYYIKDEVCTITVKYVDEDGGELGTASVEGTYSKGDPYTIPDEIYNREFTGYERVKADPKTGNVWAKDTVITITYRKLKNTATVTYVGDGAPAADTVTWTDVETTSYTVKEPEPKEHYTFKGWQDVEKNTHEAGEELTLHNEDKITLTAVWAENAKATLQYDANAGDNETASAPAPETFYADDDEATTIKGTVSSEPAAWDDDHVFLGWAETANATEPTYQPDDPIDLPAKEEATTLYAVWKERTMITLTYQGENVETFTDSEYVDEGSETVDFTIASAPATISEGMEFAGWESADGTVYEPGEKYPFSKDTILTAKWVSLEYDDATLRFDANSGDARVDNLPADQTARERKG